MVGVGAGEAVGVIVAVSVGVSGKDVRVLVAEGAALGDSVMAGISVCWSGVTRSAEVQPAMSKPRTNNQNEMVLNSSLAPIRPYYNPYAFYAAL
jgi:hypothetical protein